MDCAGNEGFAVGSIGIEIAVKDFIGIGVADNEVREGFGKPDGKNGVGL